MKTKVSEASGATLDWMVAKCECRSDLSMWDAQEQEKVAPYSFLKITDNQ